MVDTHDRHNPRTTRADYVQACLDQPLPRLCAHQGLSHACPPNTLPAFAAALAVGAHEIEFDLWLSKDNHPIVCHDPTVDRTTDGRGTIADMTLAQIAKLDAGIGHGNRWASVRVPTLDQVLRLLDGRTWLNIHVKDPGPDGRLVEQVAATIFEEGLVDTAYIAGSAEVLDAARQIDPNIARACLHRQEGPDDMIDAAIEYECRRVQFGYEPPPTEAQIARAHAAGLICNLFRCNDPAALPAYLEQGIDVVLTDRANDLLAVWPSGTDQRGVYTASR